MSQLDSRVSENALSLHLEQIHTLGFYYFPDDPFSLPPEPLQPECLLRKGSLGRLRLLEAQTAYHSRHCRKSRKRET